ncbi:unnamed protein product [Allacma fusca]|uniref:CRAL-TRIO domain-containing protein n=1 Tax=Allacma fusca TaxID=39272 RepID=A0A8J2P3A9_9HEXA|nr:unnamed protein product [Allacma fusca]
MSKCDQPEIIYMDREDVRNCPVYKFLRHPIFLDLHKMTDEEHLNFFLDMESFEAPEHFHDVFSYKFVGYSADNQPIWIITFGKYPTYDLLQQGEGELMERYIYQTAHWIAKSIVEKTPEENPGQQAIVIFNGKGASASNYLNTRTLGYLFKLFRKTSKSSVLLLARGIGVNVNKVGVVVLNLLRPISKETFKKVELFGKDDSVWRPRLEEIFGHKDIPTFTGMHRGFYRIKLNPPINPEAEQIIKCDV